MIVTALEPITKKRTKVFLDENFAFVLYPQDIRNYHIAEGMELEDDLLQQIYQETILRRAKKKALDLLVRMDYSEYAMRQRLKRELYPDRAIEDTISFLYSYHYLDDRRYTEQFMLARGSSSGYGELKQKLLRQGIDADMIRSVYDSLELDSGTVLQEQMKKKLSGRTALSAKEKNRILSYFLRRGFSFYEIEDCLKTFSLDIIDDLNG